METSGRDFNCACAKLNAAVSPWNEAVKFEMKDDIVCEDHGMNGANKEAQSAKGFGVSEIKKWRPPQPSENRGMRIIKIYSEKGRETAKGGGETEGEGDLLSRQCGDWGVGTVELKQRCV